MSNLIVLKQKPIIEFSEMEARGLDVAESIKQLNLDTIKPTEQNRSTMKKIRADLNKELSVFEDQRKMIHGAITDPYNSFTDSYKANIKIRYTDAINSLKGKIGEVESKMLDTKTSDIKAYFDDEKGDFKFISIDDIELNIILSASNKKLREQVDKFISAVSADVSAINKMDNSVRIMSLYEANMDLSSSVSTVLSDIEREARLEKERVEKERIEKERIKKEAEQKQKRIEGETKERLERKGREAKELEASRIRAEKNAELNKSKEAELELKRIKNEEEQAAQDLVTAEKESERIANEIAERESKEAEERKIHKMTFTVSGKISQLKAIKEFIKELGVEYE